MTDLSYVHFRKLHTIGHGAFGRIYLVEDPSTHKKYALKFESFDVSVPQLSNETSVYNVLRGGPGIPRIWAQGTTSQGNYIVTDLLGLSLEQHLNKCKRHFSLKTVLMLADQMIDSIQFMHERGYIHRDIKTDNFVMGIGSHSSYVYMIDYGLAMRYIDPTTGEHNPYREGLSLSGTARYASINALSGIEQSRRDDMEGLGYVLIYLLKGSLPWQGIGGPGHSEKHEKICKAKKDISPDELCHGLPKQFATYIKEVRSLGYSEKPHYSSYKKLFKSLFAEKGYVNDNVYDWSSFDEGAMLGNSYSDDYSYSEPIKRRRSSSLKERVRKPYKRRDSEEKHKRRETPKKEMKRGMSTDILRKQSSHHNAKRVSSVDKFAKREDDYEYGNDYDEMKRHHHRNKSLRQQQSEKNKAPRFDENVIDPKDKSAVLRKRLRNQELERRNIGYNDIEKESVSSSYSSEKEKEIKVRVKRRPPHPSPLKPVKRKERHHQRRHSHRRERYSYSSSTYSFSTQEIIDTEQRRWEEKQRKIRLDKERRQIEEANDRKREEEEKKKREEEIEYQRKRWEQMNPPTKLAISSKATGVEVEQSGIGTTKEKAERPSVLEKHHGHIYLLQDL